MSKSTPRQSAEAIIHRLHEHGHQAVLAGGCVRDMLLNRTPKDYDVATSARPEQIVELFRITQKVGIQFGVVIVRQGRHWIEVATFRSDGAYVDGRHPRSITFSSAEEDAKRRDFTINGMFFDPLRQEVIDYVGGQEDLKAGVVRAIGDPAARFREDRLRMLRAVRFSAGLQYAIDSATEEAIRRQASEITVVSAERIREELSQMFADRHRTDALNRLLSFGLLATILPEAIGERKQMAEVIAVVQQFPASVGFELVLAVLLAQCAPPAVDAACRRLTCSNTSRRTVKWLVVNRSALDTPEELSLADLKRLAVHADFPKLLEWARARGDAEPAVANAVTRVERRCADIPEAALNPPPLLTGDDLHRLAVPPGPIYKRVLETVRYAQLNEEISTHSEAEAMARKWLDTEDGV